MINPACWTGWQHAAASGGSVRSKKGAIPAEACGDILQEEQQWSCPESRC
jgi:hypothetical protein